MNKEKKLHFENQVIHIKRQIMTACMVNGQINLRRFFKMYDKAEDGELGLDEFTAMIRKTGKVTPKVFPDNMVKMLFKMINANGDGEINYEQEFLAWLDVAPGEDEPQTPYTIEAAAANREKAARKIVKRQMVDIKKAISQAAYEGGSLNWEKLFSQCEKVPKEKKDKGSMDLSEFTTLLRKKAKLMPPLYSDEVVKALYKMIDEDGSGSFELAELTSWLDNGANAILSKSPSRKSLVRTSK